MAFFYGGKAENCQNLLSNIGVIIVNIDEHESHTLMCLLQEIFGEENNIGEIIWNKQNPKGDSLGISAMHETIFVFVKIEYLFANNNVCIRKKTNAEIMINKANKLFKKLGKKLFQKRYLLLLNLLIIVLKQKKILCYI